MATGSLIGALAGLAVGLADFVLLGALGRGMAARSGSRRRAGQGALEAVRVIQLVVFPVAGWFAGPYILG